MTSKGGRILKADGCSIAFDDAGKVPAGPPTRLGDLQRAPCLAAIERDRGNLDDDLVTVRKHRTVHLADRRSRDRGLAELEERLLEREPQVLLDHRTHLSEGEWRHVVLKAPQLRDLSVSRPTL